MKAETTKLSRVQHIHEWDVCRGLDLIIQNPADGDRVLRIVKFRSVDVCRITDHNQVDPSKVAVRQWDIGKGGS